MKPTDITDPEYFHKVVDCQWACPAHTPVPEYIRLIAQRRYTDAYMVNWESNVFPGNSRPHLRPALRTGLPARAGRRKTGRDLPPEARRRRQQGRHRSAAAGDCRTDKNGKRIALHRRRARLADGGARSGAARLRRASLFEKDPQAAA